LRVCLAEKKNIFLIQYFQNYGAIHLAYVEVNWSIKITIRTSVPFLGVTPISFVDYAHNKLNVLSHFRKS